MLSICCYFQVHQPFRLSKDYSFFDIGKNHLYEDEALNKQICLKVARKSYLKANNMMLKLIKKYQGKFRVSYSISGMALEQFELYMPDVITSFQELVKTGCVELISETYYHSLAFIYSPKEFHKQVELHREKIKSLFNYESECFRNTELIYNDDLALAVEKMGYKAVITEGTEKVLFDQSPNFIYQPSVCNKIKLLLRNYRFSDDIAFRYSDQSWNEYPLTTEKYAKWLIHHKEDDCINLFMDYETFGEHQWEDSGIFQFFENLPERLFNEGIQFRTPSELAQSCNSRGKIDVPNFISWADTERDTSAWRGNHMQNSSFEDLYALEEKVLSSNDKALIHQWRKLQTSDHFYYMCTKRYNDGCVHDYFNPYNSPHDAYIIYSNVLNDFSILIDSQ